jgi:hypothetical protein
MVCVAEQKSGVFWTSSVSVPAVRGLPGSCERRQEVWPTPGSSDTVSSADFFRLGVCGALAGQQRIAPAEAGAIDNWSALCSVPLRASAAFS